MPATESSAPQMKLKYLLTLLVHLILLLSKAVRSFWKVRPMLRSLRLSSESRDLQKLYEIVIGIGGLDEMEAALNQSTAELSSITPALVFQVVEADLPTRRLLRFFSWARRKSPELGEWDPVFNHSIQVLAKKKDFAGVDILISDLLRERRRLEATTFCCLAESLVKSGREDDALGIFKNLNKFNCPRDDTTVSAIVHALCSKGHARKAQSVLWHHRRKLSLPVEPCLYRALLHGWFICGNVKEARAVLEEIKSLGISPGLSAYNAFLHCVCTRNLRFNPSALVPDATGVMTEMRTQGIPPTSVSFNILLSCLSKVRRVKEACRVLSTMRGGSCSPDWMSYYLVARVLYLTGRLGRGDEVVDQMIGDALVPQARFYHGLVALLCGIDKVGHALDMLERLKKNLHCPLEERGRVYDLLIPKLCRSGNFDKGRQLWNEAVENGIELECSSDLLDPSKTEVFAPSRKVEKANLEACNSAVKKDRPKNKVGKKKKAKTTAAV